MPSLNPMNAKRWAKVGIAVVAVLAVTVALVGIQISRYPKNNYVGRYDCAIVLGAAVHDGKPSPVFQARLSQGIELYKNGVVDKLIFTGGIGDGETLSEGEVGAVYAHEKGVRPADTLVESASKTTLQNLQEAKRLMDNEGLASAVLVSDPLHLRRSVRMARWLKMDVGSSAARNSRYQTWKTKLPFLLREIYFTIHFKLFRQ